MAKTKYITAFDPKIKKRVPFTVKGGVATSMITKKTKNYKPTSFKYKPKKRR